MSDLTGMDAIRASSIVSAYTAHFARQHTQRQLEEMRDLAIRLNNYGVGRPD